MDDEKRNPIDFGSRGQRSRSTLALYALGLMGTIQTTVYMYVQSHSNFTCTDVGYRWWRENPFDFGSQGHRSTLPPCKGMPHFALSSFGRIATPFRLMDWWCLSVRLSVNILVNLCVQVLGFALQSSLTVFSGFLFVKILITVGFSCNGQIPGRCLLHIHSTWLWVLWVCSASLISAL